MKVFVLFVQIITIVYSRSIVIKGNGEDISIEYNDQQKDHVNEVKLRAAMHFNQINFTEIVSGNYKENMELAEKFALFITRKRITFNY
jgi:hypothetical protein